MGEAHLSRIVVAGLLWRPTGIGPEFLLTQRAATLPFWPGRWVIPGGGVDPIDSEENEGHGVLARALRREMNEEVSPDLEYDRQPVFVGSRGFERPDGIQVVVLTFLLRWRDGQPRLNPEVDAFDWVTLMESRDLDVIDTIRPEIERAHDLISAL